MSTTASWSLGSLCDIQSGGTPSRSNSAFYGGSIPWAKIADLETPSGIVTSTEERLTEEGVRAIRGRVFEPGTLLFAIYGSIGKMAFAGTRMSTNQAILGIRAKPGAPVVDKFLYYWLLSQGNQLLADGMGVTQKNLSAAYVRALPFPAIAVTEQRRITAILDKADAIRRKRQQALSKSASLEQSVFLGAVGPQAKEYQGWEPVSFEELAKPGKGTMRTGPFGSDLRHSEFVDEGVAVLGIDNAVQNRFAWAGRRFITQEKYEKLTRYTVLPGDVIVTIMGTTGRSAVVPDDIPLAITTKHLATITPDRAKVEPEFLSNALHRHPAVLSQIKMANKGAIMDGLNLGIIKGLRVPLPPIEVQRQYVADLGHIRAVQAKMQQDYLEAETLFASLSQRAFRGDLSPASVPA